MTRLRPLARLGDLLRGAARGYGRLALSFGKLIGFLAVIAAASAAVVIPAWLLATRFPAAFTVAACAAFAAALAALLGLRLRRATRSAGGLGAWLRARLLPFLGRLGFVLAALASIYLLALLYAARLFAVAVPATLVVALAAGWRARRPGGRGRPHPAPSGADDRGDGGPL
jgi:hypothetical protein